jgi:hypothetical protein
MNNAAPSTKKVVFQEYADRVAFLDQLEGALGEHDYEKMEEAVLRSGEVTDAVAMLDSRHVSRAAIDLINEVIDAQRELDRKLELLGVRLLAEAPRDQFDSAAALADEAYDRSVNA